MKQILKGIGAAALIGVLAILCVPAEAAEVRASIPFSFSVNDKTLAPGTYTVTSGATTGLVVRGLDGGAMALAGRLSSTNSSPRLVFHRYGDEYILREVWMGSDGHKLPESKREHRLANAQGGDKTARFARVEVPVL